MAGFTAFETAKSLAIPIKPLLPRKIHLYFRVRGVGQMLNRQDWVGIFQRRSGGLLVLGSLLILSACADSNQVQIRDACIAANSRANPTPAVSDWCTCIAADAKKYLDDENYERLAKVSTIYMSERAESDKTAAIVGLLVDDGMTPAQAGLTALDFMMLAHKVSRECTT